MGTPIKEIILVSLPEALKGMQVGETRIAPSGCTDGYVKAACSELNKGGYQFNTFMHKGERLITRVK